MALTDKLTAIGDAIRSKTGGSDLLTLDEMPQEIQSIQTGGGGTSDTSLADSIIDGTITSYSSDSLTEVAEYGLNSLPNLVEASLPNVETIGNFGVSYVEKLSSLSIPKVKSIGKWSFNNVGIESFDCPELKHIGEHTLCYCDSLTTLNIPNVETIGYSSFCYCSSLESIVLKKVKKGSADIGSDCPNLKSADLYLVTSVEGIFRNSPNFETLIIRTQDVVCSAVSSSFLKGTKIASGTGYIYVPSALLEQYKVAINWKKYANQFRAIEDYPEICGGEF